MFYSRKGCQIKAAFPYFCTTPTQNFNMQLFYLPGNNINDSLKAGNHFLSLSAEESVHAVKVMRMKPGDQLKVTDGLGNTAIAEIDDPNPKACTLRIISIHVAEEKNFRLHIAVAPTKNTSRFEWFLEKATEFGIDEITPVYCDHSERQKLRTDRLEKIVVAAMKQSLSAYLPVLNQPINLEQLIKENSGRPNCFIAWVDDQPRLHLKDACKRGKDALVLIGPEGDFSQREIELSLSNSFIPVSLGKARLRTETAALASCFIVNLLNEPGL